MVKRPTTEWREDVAAEAAEMAAGTLDPDEASAAELFPDELIAETDEVLTAFEADVAALTGGPPADAAIFDVIERTVKALNEVNVRFGEAAYETDEREQLCAYIEDSLDSAGLDVDAFAARNGMTRHEITDRWRDW